MDKVISSHEYISKNVIAGIGIFFCVCAAAFVSFWNIYLPHLNNSPSNFPINSDITILEGSTQSEIATYLVEQHVINSNIYFYIYLSQNFKDSFIKAGTYRFSTPRTTSEVVNALVQGTDLSPLVKVTFPEGFSIKNISTILGRDFTKEEVDLLLGHEGHLFPDTYFISKEMKLADIIELMRSTFDEKLIPYSQRINDSKYSLEQILIIASLIEREANDEISMKMVSAILQNRLAINMPLQVDAVFDYLLDKTSEQLTLEDLAIDSPYNTYTHTGLPPTAIANPGLIAIEAVLSPSESTDLYYLTDNQGNFHYAATFEEHKRNKESYLK